MRKIKDVQPLHGHKLLVTYTDGEKRIGDITPLLSKPVFAFLRDESAFRSVYLSYGALTWKSADGEEVDICPDKFYMDSIPA